MKLNKERFDSFAQEQGYVNGAEMYDEMGLNKNAYKHYRNEVPINGEVLRVLCWHLGTVIVTELVSLTEADQVRYKSILEEF